MKKRFLSAVLAAMLTVSMAVPVVLADETPTGVVTSVTSAYVGNIFFDKTPIELKVSFTNNDKTSVKKEASYTVTNGNGSLITSGNLTVDLKGGETKEETVSVGVLDYDTYYLNITSDGQTQSFDFSSAVMSKSTNSDDSFGVCTHLDMRPKIIGDIVDLMDKAGISWNRDEYYWDHVETEKGVYNFYADHIVDPVVEKGNNSLIILDYGNNFYGGAPHDEEGYKGYAEYCRQMATHLKGKVDTFEIWNEWNGGFGGGYDDATYANMFTYAAKAIKEANPDAYIVACATGDVDMKFIKTVLDIAGIDLIDAISMHPYAYPSSPESGGLKSNIKKVHDLAKQYGKDVDVWATELGYPTADGIIDETTGAAYQARLYVYSKSLAGRDKLFLYDFQNDGTNSTYTEHNFGLVRYEDAIVPMAAKRGYLSISNATNILGDAQFESVTDDEDNLQIYKFKKGDEGILSAWTLSGFENVGINVGCDEVTLTDWLGNAKTVKTQNGVLTVSLNEKPVYISGNFSSYKVEEPQFNVNEKNITVAKGETVNVSIDRGAALTGKSGKIDATLPDGCSIVSGNTFDTDGDITLALKVDPETQNGTYMAELNVEADGAYIGKENISIEVVEETEISIKPALNDINNFSKWRIDVSIKNNSHNKNISGKLVVTEPEEYAGIEMTVPELKFGESFTGTIDPKTEPQNKLIPLNIKFETNDGKAMEVKRNVSCLAAVKAQNEIKIDGIIEANEWDNSMKFKLDDLSHIHGFKGGGELEEYTGDDDQSAFGYLKWDDDNFYMMVQVTDDIHLQESSGSGIWQGDGLQFAIDPSRGEAIGKNGWHEIGIAVTNEGETNMWKWLSIPGIAGGEVKDYEYKAVRNEETKKTTYEVRIPWKQLLPLGTSISAGNIIGFSVLANEDDGKGRDGWIEYMCGIGREKDANRFGDVILLDAPDTISDSAYAWADTAANNLYLSDIISKNYSGGREVTAGEFVDMLSKSAAVDKSILEGEGFDPNKVLTRQDMVVIIDKVCGGQNADTDILKAFADNDQISDYAFQSFANLVAKKIISGNGTMLFPLNDTILAEAATAIYNTRK